MEHMSTTNFTSLDYEPWRRIFLGKVERAISEYGFDGIHIDQAARYMNLAVSDTYKPHDNQRGFFLAMHAIRKRHPGVLLQFENVCENNLGLSPCFEWGPGDERILTPLCKKLLYPYIRITGHLHTSGPHGEGGACFSTPISQERADQRMRFMRLNDYVPTMTIGHHTIDLTTAKARQYFAWAREYDSKIESGRLDYARGVWTNSAKTEQEIKP